MGSEKVVAGGGRRPEHSTKTDYVLWEVLIVREKLFSSAIAVRQYFITFG